MCSKTQDCPGILRDYKPLGYPGIAIESNDYRFKNEILGLSWSKQTA